MKQWFINSFEGHNMRNRLINAYLDYFNNYLTPAKWAEHNGLSEEHGRAFLALAKAIYESKHPEA
jgi:hypothetical protein